MMETENEYNHILARQESDKPRRERSRDYLLTAVSEVLLYVAGIATGMAIYQRFGP